MTVEGQTTGELLIEEGYTNDSMGFGIDPGAIYNYRGVRYLELTAIWRAGISFPKKPKPIVREP